MAEFRCAVENAYLMLRSRRLSRVFSVSSSKLRASSSSSPSDTHTRGTVPFSTPSHLLPISCSNFLDDMSRRMCDTATLDRPCCCASRAQSSRTWLTNSSYFVKTRIRGTAGAPEGQPMEKKCFSSSDTERFSSLATQYHMQWTRSSCRVEGVERDARKSRTRAYAFLSPVPKLRHVWIARRAFWPWRLSCSSMSCPELKPSSTRIYGYSQCQCKSRGEEARGYGI